MPATPRPVDLDRLRAAAPITVLGSGFVDRAFATARLPRRGEDLVVDPAGVSVGGCGLNVARGLCRLGLPVVPAIPVGEGPNADAITAELSRLGLKSALPPFAGDNGTCLALVEPDGERTFLTVTGVERRLDAAALAGLPPPTGWAYVSGYELFGPGGAAVFGWLGRGAPAGVLVDGGPAVAALDRAGCARLAALGAVLSVNDREATLVPGAPLDPEAPAAHLARVTGLPVIVRCGAAGAVVAEPGGAEVAIPCPAVAVHDAIGAGDAHAAGTLAGLASGWTLAEAAALGCLAGSLSVTRAGADGAPTRAALQRFIEGTRAG